MGAIKCCIHLVWSELQFLVSIHFLQIFNEENDMHWSTNRLKIQL